MRFIDRREEISFRDSTTRDVDVDGRITFGAQDNNVSKAALCLTYANTPRDAKHPK